MSFSPIVDKLLNWASCSTTGRNLLRTTQVLRPGRPERRVLGIWHFQTISGSIGDGTIFHENLLCLMHRHKLERIDVAFVDDPSHSNSREPRYAYSPAHKEKIVETCRVNPYLGAVLRFDSHPEFLRFLRQNLHRYVVHPPIRESGGYGRDERAQRLHRTRPVKRDLGEYCPPILPYDCRPIRDFFETYGFVPRQHLPSWTLERISGVLRDHVAPALPIILQVRNNPSREPGRNTDLEAWLELPRAFANDPRYMFVFTGTEEELADSRISGPNILKSKDHLDSLTDDLALIQCCHAGIFQPSGLANFAWYAKAPVLVFAASPELLSNPMYDLSPDRPHPYFTRYQRMFWGPVRTERLIREFRALMEDLEERDVADWTMRNCTQGTL